jgi:hypothetical protein
MTRIIVCDTGPLLHLSEAGAIHLSSSAGEVLMPPLVAIEFATNAQGWQPLGEVLVLAMPQPAPVALIGELSATQVRVKGAAGILVDASVRDINELVELGLPTAGNAILRKPIILKARNLIHY